MAISDAVHLLERELREIFGPRCSRWSCTVPQPAGTRSRRARPRRGADADAGGRRDADARRSARVRGARRRGGTTPAWRRRCCSPPRVRAVARRVSARVRRDPRRSRRRRRARIRSTACASIRPISAAPAKCRRAATCCTCGRDFSRPRARRRARRCCIVRSAPPFAALLRQRRAARRAAVRRRPLPARHARADAGPPPARPSTDVVAADRRPRDLPSADAERLFPPYLDAVEQLVTYIDGWREPMTTSESAVGACCMALAVAARDRRRFCLASASPVLRPPILRCRS